MKKEFSGSYETQDVSFLLMPIVAREMSVTEKERYIANGGHYSDVLTPEKVPTTAYLELFARQLELRASRVALDVLTLAAAIDSARLGPEVVVVSLARAGTPVGILATRALRIVHGRNVKHYGVSIVRDRGLDLVALSYICARHSDESIVFVDGWTGKGVIGRELRQSVDQFNLVRGKAVSGDLFVLADIAGAAFFSATREDYLLPSAVLNATVSGLISRTVLTSARKAEDFHGCTLMSHLSPWDRSREFVNVVWSHMASPAASPLEPGVPVNPAALREALAQYMCRFDLSDVNLVKPGVGESTRVLLRRAPRLLVLRNKQDTHVEHLMHLAQKQRITIEEDFDLPCRALAIIDQPD